MDSDLPKVLVPLNGRPMIKYLMDALLASGSNARPIIVVSPDNQEIISHALLDYQADYVVQAEQLGTGQAVACAVPQLQPGTDHVVVLYGDHPFLKPDSIRRFISLEQPAVTIMPTVLPDFSDWRQNFYHWGRIVRGEGGRVERIVEFKDASEAEKLITEVNPGFMSFNRRWLEENISRLRNDNKQAEYYLTDLIKLAFDGGYPVGTTAISPEEAMGINSRQELEAAASLLRI